jgi:hypothetical protein
MLQKDFVMTEPKEEKFNWNHYILLRNAHIASKDLSKAEYESALDAVKSYLDKFGFKMPIPLYKFDIENTKTWYYLDNMVSGDRFTEFRVRPIINPHFMFRNLRP